jgi:uncharacterized phage protein gp47/JayE
MNNIPTLNQLYNQIIADFESSGAFDITIPVFGKNFLRGLAMVQAAKLKIYYLLIGKVQKNIFADTADSEANGGTLERFGRVKLNRNPFAAIAGVYDVEVTGLIGSTIQASTTFKSDDNSLNGGYLFVLDETFILTSTTDTISLRALTSGLESRLIVGDTLTSTQPISGVNSQVEVTAITTIPQSAETIEEYRRKTLEAYRLEPQGGSGADYRLWAFEVQGVKQAYPYATSGFNNEIDLFIEAIDGDGVPTNDLLDDVRDNIELPTSTRPARKPLGIFQINYLPIETWDIDIVINDFVDLTTEIEEEIEEAIIDVISQIRPFVSSVDILSERNDIISKNIIIQTILNTRSGSVFGAIDLSVNGNPVTSSQFLFGRIPLFNSLTFA